MKASRTWQFCISVLLTSVGLSIPAMAQVTPDGSLSTTVSQSGNNFTITNGNQVGNNLFHSFSQFSVPTGGLAYFNHPFTIQNIFARVTGGSASNIDGLIRTNGAANLFLLNPAGILFGPNARLNMGGSFIATTANSIIFEDGTQFTTSAATAPPLLSMSVPVGLQLGANAGPIRMQGNPPSFFSFSGLQLAPGKTLALVGSDIDLAQTNLSAPDGRVELWAVKNADIKMDNQAGWQLMGTPPAPTDWGTVTLRQSSYVNTGSMFGFGPSTGGPIQVRARGLTLQEGSSIASSTSNGKTGNPLLIKTTEFVDLLGASDPDQYRNAGLSTTAYGVETTAGDIIVETPKLRLANGAWLQSSVSPLFDFFTGQISAYSNNSKSGNITIRATDVEVRGDTPFPSPFFPVGTPLDVAGNIVPTAITTVLGSPGTNVQSGDITITADRVRLLAGGRISTDLVGGITGGSTFVPTGRTGNISIQASESLEIDGVTRGNMVGAVISSIQPGAQGEGGSVTIATGQLQLRNGGTISTALAGTGTAGNINIRATDVTVSDPAIDSVSQTVGGITATVAESGVGQGGSIHLSAERLHILKGGQVLASSLGQGTAGSVNLTVAEIDVQGVSNPLSNGRVLPSAIAATSISNLAAGSVNITTNSLAVRDRAEITVSNTGSGDAGNLNVTARNIFLSHGASLRAEVNGGDQGNIRLQVSDVLLLRYGSRITTNAQGKSTGGNIDINARFVVAVPTENSDIVANAVLGSGGNIRIVTQGIFGLKFRNQLTPDSDITASSQFGVSGNVQINTIKVDPSSGLVNLPADVVDSSQQITAGCAGNQGNSFVVTGRGGVPQNPTQQVVGDRTWEDVRDLSAYRQANTPVVAQTPASTPVLVQATTWQQHPDGTVELIAESFATAPSWITCNGQTVTTTSFKP